MKKEEKRKREKEKRVGQRVGVRREWADWQLAVSPVQASGWAGGARPVGGLGLGGVRRWAMY